MNEKTRDKSGQEEGSQPSLSPSNTAPPSNIQRGTKHPTNGAAIAQIVIGGGMLAGGAYIAFAPNANSDPSNYATNPGTILALFGGMLLLYGLRKILPAK